LGLLPARQLRRSGKAPERAVELKPDDPTINDHLGDAYEDGRTLENSNGRTPAT
jgi:hypothetical protein